jgi:predicted permease
MALLKDIGYGMRQLIKSPGYAISTIASLALGIGATTAIFSVVYGVLLNPYPYRNANRIVHVELHLKNGRFGQLMVNHRQFEEVRHALAVEDVFFEDKQQRNLTGEMPPVALSVGFYSPNFFDYMGVPPILGREFTPADAPGGNPAPLVVLSYPLWQEHYGGRRDVVGRTIEFDRVSYTVIGVVPPRFRWGDCDAYALAMPTSDPLHYGLAYPRLKNESANDAAQAEFQSLVNRFAAEDPKNYPQDSRVKLASLNDELLGSFSGTVALLFGAALGLLVIGCVNVSNLMVARGISRYQEFAVRTSLGASRWRLVRQLLTESILLSLISASLGILASYWGVQVIARMLPDNSVPHEAVIRLNLAVLIFSVCISVLSGIVFGLSPAFQLSRSERGSLLQAGSLRTAGRLPRRLMHRLPLAGQAALTLMLLASAGGALKLFLARIHTPLGFDPENVFQIFVEFRRSAWPEPINQRLLFGQLDAVRENIAQAPGVTDAGVSTWQPLMRERSSGISIPDKPDLNEARAALMEISPQLISVLRIPLLRGRVFDQAESSRRAPLALVNQAFVNQYLRGMEPIGQLVRIRPRQSFPEVSLEVIGVLGDAINDELDPVKPAVFFPYSVDPNLRPGELIFVRASSDAEAAIRSVKARLSETNPDLIVTNVRTFQYSLETYGWASERLAATIFAIYALTALVLAASGVYGVVSFAVTQEKRALGIRLALGATRMAVVRLVLRSTAEMLALGVAGGLIVTLIWAPIISSWGGGNLSDPFTLLGAVFVMTAVGAVACLLPAWRAAMLDPMQVLRAE